MSVDVCVGMRNRIREMRRERGWSQAELAATLGVSRQTVNALEAGRWDPRLEMAFKAAKVFDVRVDELFLTDVSKSGASGHGP